MMPDFEKFRANGTDYTVRDPNAIHDISAYRTSAQQDMIDSMKISRTAQVEKTSDMTQAVGIDTSGRLWVKESSPTVKTTMDSVAAVNTQYILGTQSAVNITMPTTAQVGQEILVCFTSGATAATLTCNLTGFDFTPKANKTNWIKFTRYNSTGDWLVDVKEG